MMKARVKPTDDSSLLLLNLDNFITDLSRPSLIAFSQLILASLKYRVDMIKCGRGI